VSKERLAIVTAPRQGTLIDVAPNASVRLVFDGGAIGNPGKGYGSFMFDGDVSTAEPVRVEFPGLTTNNQAEYLTLIHGLCAIIDALERRGIEPSQTSIDVWSDSQLVVEQINGRWKIRDATLAGLVNEARSLLKRFASWRVTWHPRRESVRILGH
jgi:probable phosphoglycerate mutase